MMSLGEQPRRDGHGHASPSSHGTFKQTEGYPAPNAPPRDMGSATPHFGKDGALRVLHIFNWLGMGGTEYVVLKLVLAVGT